MEHEHPLSAYSKRAGKSIREIAESAGCSRMTLYRVMKGDNATVDLLRRISDATGGEVKVADFLVSTGAAA
jgi:transcriptional regulator with XRE-family HTH domain